MGKGVLQEACGKGQYWRLKDKDGKPPGALGWMPEHVVTFIDNHDTGSTQRHWPFPEDRVMVGYAYTLTHPGIPSLFWDHVMDWGDDFRKRLGDLIRARRTAAIKVDSPVKIKCAEQDLYIAEVGEASKGLLRIALGPRDSGNPDRSFWSDGPQGNCYRVWVHAAPTPKTEPVTESLPQATAPKAEKTKGTAQVEKVHAAPTPQTVPVTELLPQSTAPKAEKTKGIAQVKEDGRRADLAKGLREIADACSTLPNGSDDAKRQGQIQASLRVAADGAEQAPEKTPRFNFKPITIDGQEITPALLESETFTKELGERLLSRLDDVRNGLVSSLANL